MRILNVAASADGLEHCRLDVMVLVAWFVTPVPTPLVLVGGLDLPPLALKRGAETVNPLNRVVCPPRVSFFVCATQVLVSGYSVHEVRVTFGTGVAVMIAFA